MNARTIAIVGSIIVVCWLAFSILMPASGGAVLSPWSGPQAGGSVPIRGAATRVEPTPNPAATGAMDSYLSGLANAGQWSGAALVAHNGTVLLAKGYGMADAEASTPNTADTRFRLASITKQFTAMAVMQLVGAGKLKLGESVCAYLPQCPAAWQPITLEHLLTHTSGLANFTDFGSYEATMSQPTAPEELVARFRNQPLLSDPGSVYRYGNSGYVLLGYLVELVSGQSYGDYLRDYVFAPLGMNDSGYDLGENQLAQGYSGPGVPCARLDATTLYAAGGLYSSVRDMYRWDQALYTPKLLPDALRAEIFTPQVGQYGFGWLITQRSGQRVVEHPGLMSGAATHIVRMPEAGLTVIVLSNLETANVDAITSQLIDLALAS